MKILIKFPSRERPEKVISCVEKYLKLAEDVRKIHFLFSFDVDDEKSNNSVFLNTLDDLCSGQMIFGKSESKIHAVNRDIDKADVHWDILLLASDDMTPIEEGYDSIIRDDMINNFPDTNGVLWYTDGYRNDIITLSIIGRKYYDRFGYIYHPSYKSFFCDNEFTEVCKSNGKVYKSEKVIITHDHPDNLRNSYDSLYVKNSKFYNEDKNNFDIRYQNNWPL